MEAPPERHGVCVKCDEEIVVEDSADLVSEVVDHMEAEHGMFE